jgi:4'-phosphopantetheinyl transferase
LNHNEIHVWSAHMPARGLEELQRLLSVDELTRAKRFHFDRDRRHFIGRRAILRIVLASYLENTPASVRFSYNDFGKPCLADPAHSNRLSFNLSHSGELIRIAVAIDRDVGIDVEVVDESVPIDSVARSFFSPGEIATLEALPESLRRAGFFSCWTRKEAYVKARGKGLSLPLASFDVSVESGSASTLVSEDPSSTVWKVQNLEGGGAHYAAVAAKGGDWKTVSRTIHVENGNRVVMP